MEDVAQFQDLTGADTVTATTYLRTNGNNLSDALDTWFANSDGIKSGASSRPPITEDGVRAPMTFSAAGPLSDTDGHVTPLSALVSPSFPAHEFVPPSYGRIGHYDTFLSTATTHVLVNIVDPRTVGAGDYARLVWSCDAIASFFEPSNTATCALWCATSMSAAGLEFLQRHRRRLLAAAAESVADDATTPTSSPTSASLSSVCPVLALVDPRTGVLLKCWVGSVVSADDLAIVLSELQPLSSESVAALPQRKRRRDDSLSLSQDAGCSFPLPSLSSLDLRDRLPGRSGDIDSPITQKPYKRQRDAPPSGDSAVLPSSPSSHLAPPRDAPTQSDPLFDLHRLERLRSRLRTDAVFSGRRTARLQQPISTSTFPSSPTSLFCPPTTVDLRLLVPNGIALTAFLPPNLPVSVLYEGISDFVGSNADPLIFCKPPLVFPRAYRGVYSHARTPLLRSLIYTVLLFGWYPNRMLTPLLRSLIYTGLLFGWDAIHYATGPSTVSEYLSSEQ